MAVTEALVALVNGVNAWTFSLSALAIWRLFHRQSRPMSIIFSYIFAVAASAGRCADLDVLRAAGYFFAHFLTLGFVVVIYRVSPFHPLAAFPGPLLFKISDLRLFYSVLQGYRYLEIDAMHKKYGDVVRIGPNKLSWLSLGVQHQFYKGSKSLDKSISYRVPERSFTGLFFMESRDEHAVRRSMWAPAFSQNMMDRYWPVLWNSITEFMDCVERRMDDKGIIDITSALQHWSFDFNIHFIFGNHSYDSMMVNGDPKKLVETGQEATVQFEALGDVPWLLHILWYLPLPNPMFVLNNFALEMIRKRRNLGMPDPPDLCSYLLGEHGDHEGLTEQELVAETAFAIQAGGDTSAAVLNFGFYHLITNPEAYKRLQAELDEAFPDADSDEITPQKLASLPYLNAVVKEQLRLSTPFGQMPRVIPGDGLVLEDRFVPGGTIVGSPTYAMNVTEKYWSPDPLKFRPERWLPGGLGPGSVADENALSSFQFGPFGCLGKYYAIRELLLVNARFLLAYDIALAPSYDGDEFVRKVVNMKTTIFRKKLCISQLAYLFCSSLHVNENQNT